MYLYTFFKPRIQLHIAFSNCVSLDSFNLEQFHLLYHSSIGQSLGRLEWVLYSRFHKAKIMMLASQALIWKLWERIYFQTIQVVDKTLVAIGLKSLLAFTFHLTISLHVQTSNQHIESFSYFKSDFHSNTSQRKLCLERVHSDNLHLINNLNYNYINLPCNNIIMGIIPHHIHS